MTSAYPIVPAKATFPNPVTFKGVWGKLSSGLFALVWWARRGWIGALVYQTTFTFLPRQLSGDAPEFSLYSSLPQGRTSLRGQIPTVPLLERDKVADL